MSLFIGKDNVGNNILHIRASTVTQSELKGEAHTDTIIHTKYAPLYIADIVTLDYPIIVDGYGDMVKSFKSADASKIATHMLSNKFYILHIDHNGMRSNSSNFSSPTGVYGNNAVSAIYPFLNDSTRDLQIQTTLDNDTNNKPGQTILLTFILLDFNRNDSITYLEGGAVSISKTQLIVGDWDFSTKSMLCHGGSGSGADFVYHSDVIGESTFSIKNYAKTQGISYSFDTATAAIYKNGQELFGSSSGKPVLAFAKQHIDKPHSGNWPPTRTLLATSSIGFAPGVKVIITANSANSYNSMYCCYGEIQPTTTQLLLIGYTIVFAGIGTNGGEWYIEFNSDGNIYLVHSRVTGNNILPALSIDILYFY